MNPKVDTGNIITVKRFPLFETDTVFSLTQRCYVYSLMLFYEITSFILAGDDLPQSDECWKRKPFKRKELNELCRITSDMSEEEIRRRVKAVTFPNEQGAYIEKNGLKIKYSKNVRVFKCTCIQMYVLHIIKM